MLAAARTTGFAANRDAMVKTYADIFRGNLEFFAEHAEYIFEHRFGLYDELDAYRARYGRVDGFIERHPWLRRILGRISRALRF